MKTTIAEKQFTPVSLTITFESQKELDDFGCLCNSTCIIDNVTMPHYSQLESLGADVGTGRDNLLRKIKKHPSLKSV